MYRITMYTQTKEITEKKSLYNPYKRGINHMWLMQVQESEKSITISNEQQNV